MQRSVITKLAGTTYLKSSSDRCDITINQSRYAGFARITNEEEKYIQSYEVPSRLSDSLPSLSILLLEGGPDNFNNPLVTHPALLRANFRPGIPHFLKWQGKGEPQLEGRAILELSGGILGGGSSVNSLIYARGQAADFDSWDTPGWSSKELLPFLKKAYAEGVHGTHGPASVSSGTYRGRALERDFIEALKGLGYDEAVDLQDLRTDNAVSHSRRYVSPKDGKRQDAAHVFLHLRLRDGEHPNLHVVVGTQVTRVILGPDKTATGVECRPNPRLANSTQSSPSQQPRIIKARKLVVLSAGTKGTPLLLERSGIGDSEILNRAGVPVAHHLPGVGHDFQDHQHVEYPYRSKVPVAETIESVYNGVRNVTSLIDTGDPILSWTGVDASAKLRPTASEVEALGGGFQRVWTEKYKENPSKPLSTMICTNGLLSAGARLPSGESYLSIFQFTAYPESRGSLHITAPGLDDPIDWETGILSDPDGFDLDAQVWAYKTQREIAHRLHNFDGEIPGENPSFPEGSVRPGSNGTAFEYSPEANEAIRKFLRARVRTTWHGIGTCKMAPEEKTGVVNADLGVHGVGRLKIADLSIVPSNVAGNTMSTAFLVGEKASDIFIQELGD
ncbi:GMC oxidoreductase [Xylariomycetidae sp. FL2044]|nr:GMC oxidoreductase [Xylariomycetidae sp. FL2044]